ncbi:hypothetical protein B0H17DRAFT_1137521 [Mycena rosella]|uniref:Uncharacterized protein n=1 Tax=Mycena rosella TaxID=1033263 RepID=A0AAD7GDA3_MYCRO|nr:hypothetical protein B0H17DRAFT_1137521 [Mycena rosella]
MRRPAEVGYALHARKGRVGSSREVGTERDTEARRKGGVGRKGFLLDLLWRRGGGAVRRGVGEGVSRRGGVAGEGERRLRVLWSSRWREEGAAAECRRGGKQAQDLQRVNSRSPVVSARSARLTVKRACSASLRADRCSGRRRAEEADIDGGAKNTGRGRHEASNSCIARRRTDTWSINWLSLTLRVEAQKQYLARP